MPASGAGKTNSTVLPHLTFSERILKQIIIKIIIISADFWSRNYHYTFTDTLTFYL